MATIKEIAEKLGVSISTVSKGLNNASDISEEMRQTVLNAAVELGYVKKKKKNADMIKFCIITEDVEQQNLNQSNYELISGFRSKAVENMYQIDVVSLSKLYRSKLTYDLFAAQNSYSGILLLTSTFTDWLEQQLTETKIPTVLFNHRVFNHSVACIGTDLYEGIHQAVTYAVKKGHTRIGFVNDTSHTSLFRNMENAFQGAMQSARLFVDPHLMFSLTPDSDEMRNALQMMRIRGVTLAICSNDLIASSVITEAYRQGRKVPEDLSVIGYDDLAIARYLSPPLTTIRQDRIALGKCAYYALKSLLGQIPAGAIIMHPTLIERESVAQLRQPLG